MSQIESYERPFNVVYGTDGGEQSIVPGPEGADFPVWRARHMVTALVAAEAKREDLTDEEREALEKIQREFQYAEVGAMVMFGLVRRWKNRKGKTRFIGLVPKGEDYRNAASGPPSPVATSERSQPLHIPSAPPKSKAKRVPTDAERIADKMARASRRAAEGDK